MLKVPYGKQEILESDIEAVKLALQSDFLTQGPLVYSFEKAFSEVVGAKYAVAVSNATSGLHLAFKVLNQDIKKKVLVTPITFAASSNCVLFENGSVDFVDIHPKSFNMDLKALEEKLNRDGSDYQGLIIVDFAGLPMDTEKLRKLADQFGLWIIEDACHAIGGHYLNSLGQKILVGSNVYTDLSVFSFHPVKHIATGEGGMVTTNDEEVYRRLLKLRSHGMEKTPSHFQESPHGGWYHEMQELGFNYRMPDINAALGLSQLSRLPTNIERRQKAASRYREALKECPVSFQVGESDGFLNAHHLFVIQTERRKELYNFLKEKNILTQVHYLPVYLHPFYQDLGFKKGLCPQAESYYSRALSLPLFHSMTAQEQDYVIEHIRAFFDS